MRKNRIVSITAYIFILFSLLSCKEKKCSDSSHRKNQTDVWNNLYQVERQMFLSDNDTSKAPMTYFSRPLIAFEQKIDSLGLVFMELNENERNIRISDLYNVLPKDYFKWDKEIIESMFNDVVDDCDLKMRILYLKMTVFHRLSYLYKSASYEVNSIKPAFVKNDTSDKEYGRFIIEARNYDYPLIVIVDGDTLPYTTDDNLIPYLSKEKLSKVQNRTANLYYVSWGDTLTFEVDF